MRARQAEFVANRCQPVLVIFLFVASGVLVASAAEKKDKSPLTSAGDARPVILLTGFEPFGEDRLPNPSWEGIRQLDGRIWNGYRLVSKQLPVIWGKPLEHLQKWNSAYHPAAIFSFGQGGRDFFSLESRASNIRGDHRDNDDHFPPTTLIVRDGPPRLHASIDCDRLVRLQAAKGYPIRVSTQAGRYLCEETLYSLEYLKAKKQLTATVLFCHVPPSSDQDVNAPYIQKFVLDLLDSWRTLAKAEVR